MGTREAVRFLRTEVLEPANNRSGTRAAAGRDCTQGLVVLQEPARRRGLGRFRKRAPDRGSDRRASTIARNCYILFSFGRSLRGRGWVIAGYRTQQTF